MGGPDGGIYFAPRSAGQVLRISAEGNVELLEPELPECFVKYLDAGLVGRDGGIYFAPCNVANVLHISAEGNVELLEPDLWETGTYGRDDDSYPYGSGVSRQDGNIYFAPAAADNVLCIN